MLRNFMYKGSYSYWLTGLGHFKTKTQHFINLCTHWWKNDQEYSKKYFFLPCTLCKLNKVMKFLGIKGPNQTDWLELVILNKKYHFINLCAYRQKNDHKNSNKYLFWTCTLCKFNKILKFLCIKGPTQIPGLGHFTSCLKITKSWYLSRTLYT